MMNAPVTFHNFMMKGVSLPIYAGDFVKVGLDEVLIYSKMRRNTNSTCIESLLGYKSTSFLQNPKILCTFSYPKLRYLG